MLGNYGASSREEAFGAWGIVALLLMALVGVSIVGEPVPAVSAVASGQPPAQQAAHFPEEPAVAASVVEPLAVADLAYELSIGNTPDGGDYATARTVWLAGEAEAVTVRRVAAP